MGSSAGKYIPELFNSLAEAWKISLITAGLSAGFFEILNQKDPITVEKIAKEKEFDPEKVDMWLYYLESVDIVERVSGGYILTDKGSLFSPGSPMKDLSGLLHLSQFYFDAAVQSSNTFKPNNSLDKLSEGKVSRDYQPKVSDKFSHALIEKFVEFHLKPTDSLLDVGCGNGSFLRTLSAEMTEMALTGVDTNLFAIEKGKEALRNNKLEDRIKLLAGDITEDMEDFPANSVDWVSAINVFHFTPKEKRLPVIQQMLRIARKGVFMTEVMVETSDLSASANALMVLLWNDFSGFFRKTEMDELNSQLQESYKDCTFTLVPIMQGQSNLMIIQKP